MEGVQMSDHIPDLTKMIGETPCNATPREELRNQIMSSVIPKNEREWWANRTIEQLERELNEANDHIKRLESKLVQIDKWYQAKEVKP
jgi:predicted RNase H-like nuclease (RuvC/YqgF family)